MSHIFISYSHKDREYAHRLAEALERQGFSAWIDDRIDYGTAWPRVIQERLDACGAFIVVMTPRAFDSTWVQNELSRAMRKGKPVFPLLLEGDAWLSVEAIQYIDVSGGDLPPERFFKRVARFAPVQLPEAGAAEPEPDALTITAPIHLELVRVPAGEFAMGSDPAKDRNAKADERPQHRVDISECFIGKHPVTNEQYRAFVDTIGHETPEHWEGGKIPKGKEDHPVVNVSWDDACDFCGWLEAKTGRRFRLPTEAEWEKAARGTDGRIYPWGNKWDRVNCNSRAIGIRDTTPVGRYSPQGDSPYQAVDMAGNIFEWCADWYDKDEYKARAGKNVTDPQGPAKGQLRVLRGGSWFYSQVYARTASRIWGLPDLRLNHFGFRVCVGRPSPGRVSGAAGN